jgi:hypothetical protein
MIREVRATLAKALAGADWPTWTFKPDDVNEVPCFVVDRPTFAIDVQLYVVTCSIVAIGRRMNDEDAQAELDDMTDTAMHLLRGPDVEVSRVEPAVVTIADLSYPAYRLDCIVGRIDCYPDTEVTR